VKIKPIVIAFFLCTILCLGLKADAKKHAVLIFCLTKGYHHASIADGIAAIQKMGADHNFNVDTTTDVNAFKYENLKKYNTLIFLSPTGTGVFNEEQKSALKQYVHNHGGIVGIHAATDFCYEWEWYGQMMGAFFLKHPKIQDAKLNIILPKNKLVRGLPQVWTHKDEWYNFKYVNPDLKVLIKIDETSYTGGSMNNDHPISWYHDFDGGKIFYTALGHTKECYSDPLFLGHVLAGIKYTMNSN
jgi:type 1 glutamine amidotransferase